MRRFAVAFCFLSLMASTTARADSEPTAGAQAELEVEKVEEEAQTEAAPTAEPEAQPDPAQEAPTEPEAQPEPAQEAPAAPEAPAEAAAVDAKVATLNLGGQVVFALAMQAEALSGLDAAMDHVKVIDQARVAGAFSVAGGAWIDMQAVTAQGGSSKAVWVEAYSKFSPLKDVDPTDASAVKAKKKELLAAIEVAEGLVDAHAGGRKGELKEGLALFKLALDPPYAYGHSQRKIYAWTAASVGTMISMAGLGSLSNPLEREQGNFGWIATGVGLTTAGIGAALIVLDAQ